LIGDEKIYITKFEKNNSKGLLFTIPTEIYGILYDFHYHFGIREPTISEKNNEIDDIVIIDNSQSSSKSSNSNSSKSNNFNSNDSNTNNLHNNITKNIIDIQEPTEIIDLDKLDFVKTKIKINPNEKIIFFHKTIQHPDSPTSNIIDPSKLTGKNEHIKCYFQNNIKLTKVKYLLCMDETNKHMIKQFPNKNFLQQIDDIIRTPFLNSIKYKKKKEKKYNKTKSYNKKKTRISRKKYINQIP
jgi:hypothetical protein